MAPPLNRSTKRMKPRRRTGSSGNTDDNASPRETRIDDLPRCILGTIFTFLTACDAARAALVSTEWKAVFRSPDCSADSIDDTDMWHGPRRPRTRLEWFDQWEWRANVITDTLTRYGGPIRRFIIRQTRPLFPTVRWLRLLSEKGVVEELIFHMPPPTFCLPYFLFNCTSLRSLSLANCVWPRIPVNVYYPTYLPAWTLPHLVELTLIRMDMMMEEVEDLLRRCPALLSMAVCYPRRGWRVRILCETLRSVTFVGCNINAQWVFVSTWKTPNLEQLLWWPPRPFCVGYGPVEKRLPRLRTLGVFQRDAISLVGVTIGNVRTIALRTDMDGYSEVQQFMDMLHNLPHLETLHVQLDNGSKSLTEIIFEQITYDPAPCLEKSLKTIVLRVPNLVHQKLAFANFLLKEAKVLKSMVICNKSMAGELLRPESRGSPNAQVVFLHKSKSALKLDMSASNYKLADPFMP